MKKCIKFFLILGLVTFLAGVGTATAALALGADWVGPYRRLERRIGTHYQTADSVSWDQDSQSFDISQISGLELEIGYGDIYVETDDTLDHEIRVSFGHSNASFGYDIEDGKLKIKYRPHRADFWRGDYSYYDYDDNQMRITLPTDFQFQKVDIELEAGMLHAQDIQADNMKLEAGAGGIQITGGKAGLLSMEVKAGGISYDGSVGRKVKAECKAGDIEMRLDGQREDFNYNIECSLGTVEIDGKTWSGINIDSTYKNDGFKDMDLECKTGSILVEFQ